MEFWIIITIISSIYILVDILLFIKSKHKQVSKRSPWLLHVSLWGNLIELISASSLIKSINLTQPDEFAFVFLRDCGVLLGHYMFYIPYILRSYRIYLVFNIEHDWDSSGKAFEKTLHRTRQIWLIKIFLLILLIPVSLCLVLFLYSPLREIFPITTSDTTSSKEIYASIIYIFICFLEQGLMILVCFKIRNVEENFNMKSELIMVCAIWSLSSVFSAFVGSDRTIWFIGCAVRNILAFFRTHVFCVFAALRMSRFEEGLTVEMLNSLEIILENERTLEYFEKFLSKQQNYKAKDSGYTLLGLYKELECRIHLDSHNFTITELEMMTNYSVLNKLNKNSSPEYLQLSKTVILKILNEKHYKNFLQSEDCSKLRKMILKEENLTYRLTQTSILPITSNRQVIDENDIR